MLNTFIKSVKWGVECWEYSYCYFLYFVIVPTNMVLENMMTFLLLSVGEFPMGLPGSYVTPAFNVCLDYTNNVYVSYCYFVHFTAVPRYMAWVNMPIFLLLNGGEISRGGGGGGGGGYRGHIAPTFNVHSDCITNVYVSYCYFLYFAVVPRNMVLKIWLHSFCWLWWNSTGVSRGVMCNTCF